MAVATMTSPNHATAERTLVRAIQKTSGRKLFGKSVSNGILLSGRDQIKREGGTNGDGVQVQFQAICHLQIDSDGLAQVAIELPSGRYSTTI